MKYLMVRGGDDRILVNSLVDNNEAHNAIKTIGKPGSTFVSIADYNEDGTPSSCPFYIDIDSSNLEDAYGTMLTIRATLMADFNAVPFVFFSGKKGFHLLLPFYSTGPYCINIIREIAFKYKGIDKCVYKKRQLWRTKGSWHSGGKRYKVLLPELIPSLKDCIKLSENNISDKRPFTGSKNDLFSGKVRNIEKSIKAPTYNTEVVEVESNRYNPPCLTSIWNLKEGPPPGERHDFLNNFIRHLRLKGYEKGEVYSLIEKHTFWRDYPKVEYTKVINTIYNYSSVGWGCKSGAGLMLRNYCDPYCPFYTPLQ